MITLHNDKFMLFITEDGGYETTTIDEYTRAISWEICHLFYEHKISVGSIACSYRKTFKEVEEIIRSGSNPIYLEKFNADSSRY